MKERNIQRRILIALSQAFQGEGVFWQNDTGTARSMDGKRTIRFGLVGSSDIIGCLRGRFVGIEVKTVTGKQRDSQKNFERLIKAVGGVYIVARSPEQAIEELISALG